MSDKKRLDPRKLMEMAVDVMNDSVPEPRGDGKATPRVGAVLWKPDGTVETASRGELRNGDHAEYTLLERKNPDRKLDGAILFSTLEPCAPGSRSHPKLGCAEHIVHARIKEVWIGIEDPDPKVDRKGIKYLQDSGVKVHLFDPDLQAAIVETNREFIDQAEARAMAARDVAKTRPIVLSEFEAALAAAELRDLDARALGDYSAAVGARRKVTSSEFRRHLAAQGLLHKKGDAFVPSGFGLLLFGKQPRTQLPHAGLLGTIHYPDGREETCDFDGPAVHAPAQAIQWIKNKLPNPIDRTQPRRREVNETIFELLREGIVNALVHRDYDIKGAKCQLVVYPEKILVLSPGLPIEPITMEQLRVFGAPMLSRNPMMHFVFAKMKLAEERGLGLKSMKSKALSAGIPLPSYAYDAPYVVLSLFREAMAAIPASAGDAAERLSDAERKGWAWLATRESVTTGEYEAAMFVPNRTAKNHLKKLTELGLLKMVGAGRATYYEVVRS